MNNESVLENFVEFQILGLITLDGESSAIVNLEAPKQDACNIRAAVAERCEGDGIHLKNCQPTCPSGLRRKETKVSGLIG